MRSIYITLLGLILTFTAFSNSSTDTTYTKEWNNHNESWEYFDRIITHYSNDQLSNELIQVFQENNWVNYNSTFYFYNNGLLIEELEKYWDDRNGKWVKNYRKLYSYNNSGLLTLVTHQYIFNDVYVNAQREVLQYNTNGLLEEKVVQKYEEAWTNFLKYQYYYNTNDLIFEENLTYWEDSEWGEDTFTLSYAYNDQGKVVKKVKTKVSGSNKIKNLIKEEFIYSEQRLEEHIISKWSKLGKKWVNKNRAEYVNNMNGYIVEILNQNRKSNDWQNFLFTEFTGENEPITGLDIAIGNSFTIYPVNYGKEAMIEFENPYRETYFVKILNEDGKLIGSATTNNNEVSIDARQMHKGLYYIELQGRNSFSGKFSIE